MIAEWGAAVEEKRPFASEYRFRRPDGTVAWLLGQATGQIGVNGETVGYVGTITDVSEFKKAQDELREQKALLTNLVDHIPATVQVKDGEGRYLLVNQRFADRFGVSADEVVGKTAHDYYPTDIADKFAADDREVLKSGATHEREFESPLLRPDGRKTILWTTKFLIPGPDGAPAAIGAINIDITERKRAEEALRESEALLTALVDHIPASVQVKDRKGRYVLVNQLSADRFGISSEELLGKTAHDYYPTDVADKYEAHDKEVLRTGEISEREYESFYLRPDGSKMFMWATKFPIHGPDGAPAAVGGLIFDVTESKRVEEALQRAHDKLEARVEERTRELTVELAERRRVEAALRGAKEAAETANRAKTEFLAAMSHELRTPLNAILGFAEVMKISPDISMGETQTEYLDIIMQSGAHLLELINDILDVSAIEAGKLELNEENVDVARLAEASVQLVRARAARGQVGLALALPDTGLCLHSDERRMKQILLNLLSNSVKFTPEGGDVSLDVHVADDGSMIFSISDTGIGMDKAGLVKAMTMFGQVDGSLARQYEGTGLGLPLTQRLVEAHGGTLELDSRPGAGTTAVVRIPAHRVVVLSNGESPKVRSI